MGARPGRSDDGQDGGFGRHTTRRMGAGLAGKTEEHRGVGDEPEGRDRGRHLDGDGTHPLRPGLVESVDQIEPRARRDPRHLREVQIARVACSERCPSKR